MHQIDLLRECEMMFSNHAVAFYCELLPYIKWDMSKKLKKPKRILYLREDFMGQHEYEAMAIKHAIQDYKVYTKNKRSSRHAKTYFIMHALSFLHCICSTFR